MCSTLRRCLQTLISAAHGLLSALSYGVGDFLSGLATRKDSALRVVAITHPLSALAMLALAICTRQHFPPTSELLWGAASGLVGLIGVLAFYKGLALGPMGAVSVISGALSAAVPVVASVLLGEPLSLASWLGATSVLLGTSLLGFSPGEGKSENKGILLGILAGLGFGMFFVLLAQAHAKESTLWVLAAARAASSLVIVPLAVLKVGLKPQSLGLILASLPGDSLGNLFYLMAVQGGSLALGALFSSLYPAFTMLLAIVVLREKLKYFQWLGVGVAMLGAVVLSLR